MRVLMCFYKRFSFHASILRFSGLLFAACLFSFNTATANNLQITNTTILQTMIQFDLSRENSWRYDGPAPDDGWFHDAVWMFFKVRVVGEEEWRHVVLDGTGVNPLGFSVGTAGTGVEMVVPDDRIGVFVRRSDAGLGSGPVAGEAMTVCWHPADSGISIGQTVEIRSFGLEMVYVPDGEFWVGDGLTGFPRTQINTGNPLVEAVDDGGEWRGGRPRGQVAPDNENWPNGYNAFYLMKYLTTQGQYADFLNSITPLQASLRAYTGGANRHTISESGGIYSAANPDRACNYISWADGTAFAAWSGLRPMTELEFEKACRGPLYPVPGEYAWGTDTITTNVMALSGAEDGTETVTNDVSSGAAIYAATRFGSLGNLPMRAGIFATNGADRVSAGAGYWGITELSGHLAERVVLVSHATGRAFSGLHGAGALDPVSAEADVENWPAADAVGVGERGLGWHPTHTSANFLRVSHRNTENVPGRGYVTGFRGARSAPFGTSVD